MRLTKKLALQITEELWTWLAEEDGRKKEDWPEWGKYREMDHDCALCEYTGLESRFKEDCSGCPYREKFCHCQNELSPYNDWWATGKKIHAQAFLEQIRSLR